MPASLTCNLVTGGAGFVGLYLIDRPASPVHYQHNPIKTAKTSFLCTDIMLGLARRVSARLLLACASEVYGDPEVNSQLLLGG